MKKLSIGVLGVAFVAALAAPAFADPVKVTGELIDVMCGTKKPASHNEACAGACPSARRTATRLARSRSRRPSVRSG